MKKILFFTQNRWAFGSIHHALCKELYRHGIYASVLDWTHGYTADEYNLLNKKYDIFVTNPEAVLGLHKSGIPLEKIVAVAHAQWDLLLARRDSGLDFFNELREFAVISSVLKTKSAEFGIVRQPKIAPIGIHVDMFKSNIHHELKMVGYSGVKTSFNFFNEDCKRGHLVEKAVNEVAGLQLVLHKHYNHLCMPGYYETVDCIIQSSTEEAGGLPAMEGAASGRLVIGTPVGFLGENGARGAGIVVPLDEQKFVEKTVEHLNYYRDNPLEYRQKCESIQQFARENYDWSCVIDSWIDLFQ